jgi:hypothetical protein
VVLDGVVSGAAALLAEELAPGARAWWVAGHRSTEPAHSLVLEQLDMRPLLEMDMRLGEGSGATAAIPLLTMAVRVLTDMATFADAGVSGPDTGAVEPETADPETTETESDETETTGTENAESAAESAESRAEAAERRAEIAERRAQAAERRAAAAESTAHDAERGTDTAPPSGS